MGIETLITEYFGLENFQLKKIVGYDNANYRIKTTEANYILKTYLEDAELLEIIAAENESLLHLQTTDQASAYPQPIPFLDGAYIKTLVIDGKRAIVRMLSYLEGAFLGDQLMTAGAVAAVGRFLAHLDLSLQPVRSAVYQARQWEWDLQYLPLCKKYLGFIESIHDRHVVLYFMQQFDEQVRDVLPELRQQLIHNDANEWNLLLEGEQMVGIIDFGDLTHAPLIQEVAVVATYMAYQQTDPVHWVGLLVSAYHEVLPLEAREVDLLYYLIAARLCLSVCNSAYAKASDPENTYATSSENQAWAMLHHWLRVNPEGFAWDLKQQLGLGLPERSTMDEALAKRKQHFSDILSVSYQQPIYMERAAFQYMYDRSGHAILDAYNNIPHVGHCHPRVVEAGQKQMAQLNTNTRYIYDELQDYAAQLLNKFPDTLNKVFFVNSGSAASDLAIRLVKAHTQSGQLMVMEHGYHGNTQLGIDVSDYKFNHPKGQGQQANILKTTLPDTYRGKFTGPEAGPKYALEAVRQIQAIKHTIGAFIAEPIVGCGGQVPLAPGYLKPVYEAIRAQGGLCISDEVQTGFGRVGDHFWGYELQGVVPDLVILGKPMGNGHPMGAVVTTEAVAASFEQGVEFFSSFGGNPVSCAIGLAVLEVIEQEGLQQQSKAVGDYYQQQLQLLAAEHPCIGDVRGSGLFIGVDMVKPGTTETDRALASQIKNYLRQQHILISTDGPDDSVLKTKPPLCFTRRDVDEVVGRIGEVLRK